MVEEAWLAQNAVPVEAQCGRAWVAPTPDAEEAAQAGTRVACNVPLRIALPLAGGRFWGLLGVISGLFFVS